MKICFMPHLVVKDSVFKEKTEDKHVHMHVKSQGDQAKALMQGRIFTYRTAPIQIPLLPTF